MITSERKNNQVKYIFKTILLLLIISIKSYSQVPAPTIPAFSFFNLDKSLFTNTNLEKGKPLLFVFFDTECDHCQHAIQYINQHLTEFKPAAIYLITLDRQEKIVAFMNRYGGNLKGKKNVTILQDLQNEFLRKFRPRKYPSIFLYSPQKQLLRYDDNEQNLYLFQLQINAARK